MDGVGWPADVQYAQEYDRLIGTDVEVQPGRIRTMPVTISGTRYVPPIPTLGTVLVAFDEANALEDPVTGALLLFDRCCREQWFANGNKRTACMLANHVLIHAGAGVLMIPPALVEFEFKDRLIECYESGDSAELDRWLMENALVRLPIMR